MLPSSLHDWPSFSFRSPLFRVLAENWIICAALIAATCLLRWCYKAFPLYYSRDTSSSTPFPPNPSLNLKNFSFGGIFARFRGRRPPSDPSSQTASPKEMGTSRQSHSSKKTLVSLPFLPPSHPPPPPPRAKQPYDAFLVLDVEATCDQGTDFNFPNEIIEFPVCLMRWKDKTDDLKAGQLEVVAEFRSFVKPTWKPILSQFCTELTGITQDQVDAAPSFPAVLASFQKFMIKHGLIDGDTGERLVRFCWCSDGPFDIRDFVVKQCFISKVPMPGWMQGDVLDVRTTVLGWLHSHEQPKKSSGISRGWNGGPRRRTLNIPAQLNALGLKSFEGRQHSGIDDGRNIARIMAELARNSVSLHPNTTIQPNRRWQWMGKHGQVLDRYLTAKEVKPWQQL